jgi:hypothetical protein
VLKQMLNRRGGDLSGGQQQSVVTGGIRGIDFAAALAREGGRVYNIVRRLSGLSPDETEKFPARQAEPGRKPSAEAAERNSPVSRLAFRNQ